MSFWDDKLSKTHQEIQAEIESIYKTFTTDGDKMQKSMKPNKKKKKNTK